MGLKKRNKVSAEFSMSSLTDIIFLLLIFFMLTSNLVSPNALNLKLPGNSNSSTSTDLDNTPSIRISKNGNYYFNDHKIGVKTLKSKMKGVRGKSIIIEPNPNAPIERVATVMDLAMRYKVKAVLAAEE